MGLLLIDDETAIGPIVMFLINFLVDIVRWARETISEHYEPFDEASVLGVLDTRLKGYPLASVVNVFKIAMICVEDESTARPTTREVVHMLTNPPQSKSAAAMLITP
ncbi:hypothetical protein Tco_0497793 [Tanacetum coccineum]